MGAQGTQAQICHKVAQCGPNCKHLITYGINGLILHYFNPNTVIQSRHSPVNNNNNGNNNSKYRKKELPNTYTANVLKSQSFHTKNAHNKHQYYNFITIWHFIIIIIIAVINLVNIHGKITDIRRHVALFMFKYDELADGGMFFLLVMVGEVFLRHCVLHTVRQ